MNSKFPRSMIPLLLCPDDKGPLELHSSAVASDQGIESGQLRCKICGAIFHIETGIARIFHESKLDPESKHELAIRDQRAKLVDPIDETSAWNQMELVPTLKALEPLAGKNVLELGCGTGRLTVLLAGHGANVLAVDFSSNSLRTLSRRLRRGWHVGLVQADCTRFAVRPRSFDRVLSTLVSNLPTDRHRAAMMALAAEAINSRGEFVFSTHHYGLREFITGEPKSGYYRDTDIYRILFRRRDIQQETARYFRNVECHSIRIQLPLLGRLGLPVTSISRIAENLPPLNVLGDLLLLVARQASH